MPFTVETRGATLRIEESRGGDGARPALLFLHYWGGSADTWRKVIALIGEGARCLAVNQRGWGGSTVADGHYDLDSMAEDVLAVVAYLELDRVILIGHSCFSDRTGRQSRRTRPACRPR